MTEPYVSIDDLASHFTVSPHTVRGWLRRRLIPSIKVGGVRKFRISEVEETFRKRSEGIDEIYEDREPEQLDINFDINDLNEDL